MNANIQRVAGKAAAKPAAPAAKSRSLRERLVSKVKKKLCGTGATSVRPVEEVAALIKKGAFILDVRTMFEVKKGMAPGAKSIPLLRLKRHLKELPKNRTIVTYCGTGERAGKARDILEANGFQAVNAGGYAGMLKLLGEK